MLVYSENRRLAAHGVAAELRLAVPRDLSVLVFEAAEPWVSGRAVSAVRIPTREMGRRAVRMLLKKIESPNERCVAEPVAYEAVFGGTVAPPLRG